MVKLIALDLDGTLMSADHMTVTQKTKEALRLAHNRGAKISIATGRTLAIIGDVCEQVPEIDYIIYSNGAGVYDRRSKKTIYKSFMPWSFCREVLCTLDKMPAFLEVYVDGVSYYQTDKGDFFPKDALPQKFVDTLMVQIPGVCFVQHLDAGFSDDIGSSQVRVAHTKIVYIFRAILFLHPGTFCIHTAHGSTSFQQF